MKKVLSLVLVIAMVLSSMSFAFAAKFEDIADTDYAKAIETLTALGVVTGYEDGTYRPEKVVTRAEMAKLIVEILGYGNLVAGSKSNFTDTQGHWADAWIALAAGKGLVVGTGDGKFTPDRTVSYDEAITMVVRALGYTDASNELKNMTWPTNMKVKAAELKLTKDVKLASTGADRGGVAQLLFNALTATLVTVNSDGDVVKSTTQTTDKDGKVVVEYTELLSRIATYDGSYDVDPDKLDAKSKNYAGDKVDLAPYMYQNIKVYLNDDDEVVYVKGNNSVLVTGTVTDLVDENGKSVGDTGFDKAKVETIVIEDANEKEFKVAVGGAITTFYNGKETSLKIADLVDRLYDNKTVAAIVTAIVTDKDNDGNVDNGEVVKNLVANKATNGILADASYTKGKTKVSGKDGKINLPTTSDNKVDLEAITVTGAVDSLEDIAENDVVIEYASIDGKVVKLVVVRESVEGEVTKTNTGATTIYVDGKSYSTSKIAGSVRFGDAIAVGDDGVFYLDDAGKIFAVDTEGAALTDYALVLGLAEGEYSSKLDGSVKTYPQIKLLTQAGETNTYKGLVSVEKNASDVVVIDDTAVYTDETASVKTVDKDLFKLEKVSGIDTISFVPTIARGTLVRYSVDKDGYIDEIEIVKTSPEKIDLDDIDSITSDNVIVFNNTNKDEEVTKVSNLKDNETHNVVYKNGKIVIIVTTNVESANDGVFGVISALNYIKNTKGTEVTEVTALIGGEKVTYLTDKKIAKGDKGLVVTTTPSAYKFKFNSSDELTEVVAINDTNDKTETISGIADSVSSTKIKIGSVERYFTGNVVVYIYDKSDDAITIGDVSDLDDGYATTAYVLDTDATTRVGLVVQVQP